MLAKIYSAAIWGNKQMKLSICYNFLKIYISEAIKEQTY